MYCKAYASDIPLSLFRTRHQHYRHSPNSRLDHQPLLWTQTRHERAEEIEPNLTCLMRAKSYAAVAHCTHCVLWLHKFTFSLASRSRPSFDQASNESLGQTRTVPALRSAYKSAVLHQFFRWGRVSRKFVTFSIYFSAATFQLTLVHCCRCFSNVGRQGGFQRISIARGCEHLHIVVHEIGKLFWSMLYEIFIGIVLLTNLLDFNFSYLMLDVSRSRSCSGVLAWAVSARPGSLHKHLLEQHLSP